MGGMPSPNARKMRKNPSEAEKALWRQIRNGQVHGHRFRRQCPVGPYIVDFACLAMGLIIEIDGSQHLNSSNDVERDAWLRSVGYRVLRFWDNEVLNKMDGVLERIVEELGGHPPS